MRRRLPILLTALGLFFSSPAGAVTLKIATVVPEGTTLMNALHAADKEIRQATDGRVKLKIYPGGVMGSDATVLKKIKIGQLHGAAFTAGGISAVYRDFQVMSLPLLFKDYREVDAIRERIDPMIMRGLDEKGFIAVQVMEVGFAYLMSSSRITALEQLRRQKTWIPSNDPIGQAVFQVIGATPTPLPLQDVLTGLQSGLIDTYFNSPVATLALQWFTRVRYLMDSPLVYTYGVLAFSKKAFKRITNENDRAVVKDILAKHMAQVDKANRRGNIKALETLKKEGIEFVPMSGEGYRELMELGVEARRLLLRKKLFSEELTRKIESLLAEFRASSGR